MAEAAANTLQRTHVHELMEIKAIKPINIASIERATADLVKIDDTKVLADLGEWIKSQSEHTGNQTIRYSEKIKVESAKSESDQNKDDLADWDDQLSQYNKLGTTLRELDTARVARLAELQESQPITPEEFAKEMASGDPSRIQLAAVRWQSQMVVPLQKRITELQQQLAEAKAAQAAAAKPEKVIKIGPEEELEELEEEEQGDREEEELETEEEDPTSREISETKGEKSKMTFKVALKYLEEHSRLGDGTLIAIRRKSLPGRNQIIAMAEKRRAEVEEQEHKETYGEILDILDRNGIEFDPQVLEDYANPDGSLSLFKGDELRPYRTPILAQLMYMAELGLIQDPGILFNITSERNQDCEEKLIDLRAFGQDHSDLVMKFFEDRLPAIETAFPKLSLRRESREPVSGEDEGELVSPPKRSEVVKKASQLRTRIRETKEQPKLAFDVIGAAEKFGLDENALINGSTARDDLQYDLGVVETFIGSLGKLSGTAEQKTKTALAMVEARKETMVLPILVGLYRVQIQEEILANFEPAKAQEQVTVLLKAIGK